TDNIAHNNCESQVQPSCENDDDLIQKWQETITLRKQVERLTDDQELNKDNMFRSTTKIFTRERSGKLQTATTSNRINLLRDISNSLNNEQKQIFMLVCDHRNRNYPSSPNKPSQLLIYLGGAGGTGKSKVIKAICEYF